MSDRVEIQLDVITANAEADLAALGAQIDETQNKLNQVVREGLQQLRQLQRVASGIVNAMTGIIKAIGGTIDPLFAAMMTSIIAAVTTIINIGMMYLIAFPGVGFAIYAAIAAFTFGFSAAARLDLSQKQTETQSRIDGILQTLSGLEGIVAGAGGRF